jgi:hypothetical protein
MLREMAGGLVAVRQVAPGSVVLFSSLSNMAVAGTAGYAEDLLATINCWKLTDESAAEILQRLKQYGAGKDDTLLIDPLSNGIFCGTDTDGNFVDPVFSDGNWHILGNLCIRPKPYVKTLLSKCKKNHRFSPGE